MTLNFHGLPTWKHFMYIQQKYLQDALSLYETMRQS